MKALRQILDKQAEMFADGKPLAKFRPAFNANDTVLFTPGEVTSGSTHVRDALDQKRMMITVVVAMLPVWIFAMYNTGLQAHLAIAAGAKPLDNFNEAIYALLGLGFSPDNALACFVHGALYFMPIWITTMAVGGFWEVVFAVARKHEVAEGFLVTGALVPLIMPATLPLWQLAIGVSFGIVIGKEIFGGVGMNILNPALTVRAFLFFAYPAQISGDKVWIAADFAKVDGFSGATYLARTATDGMAGLANTSWMDAFIGLVPGSMGETSAAACILGAIILVMARVGSHRTMIGCVIGTFVMAGLLNLIGSDTNPAFAIPWHWHLVLGGWMLGATFMATDPVSSAYTDLAKWVYGFLIGVLVVLIRVINPAYPEGMMLAILFMNVFAPLIDHYVVQAHIKRRMARVAA